MAPVEVRIYARDGVTLRDTIAGKGLSCSHRSGIDSSDISFTGKVIEAAIGNDPGLFDDGIAKVYVDRGEGWEAWGPPYVLAPGGGTVIGQAEQAAHEFVPAGKSALMLTQDMAVLHYGGQVWRRGPRDISYGWQHPAYSGAGFTAPTTVSASSLTAREAKYDKPSNWQLPNAKWIYDGDGAGGLTLFRSPTFSVPEQAKYYVMATADEEYKVSLHGPGYGGVILDEQAQEDGFKKMRVWGEVLPAGGPYRLTAEMRTINSPGGDGWDAFRCAVGVMYRPATLTEVLVSDSSWRVKRMTVSAQRPGLTIGHLLRVLLQENATYGIPSASLLVPSFSDTLDSAGVAWAAGVERSWPVGTPLSQVLADLSDLVDFDVDHSFNLHAYQQRGSAKAVTLTAGAAPATAAMSVVELTYQSEPITATRAVVLTDAGYVEKIDTAAEVTTNARITYLESTQAQSTAEGTRLGERHIGANKAVRTVYTAKTVAVEGNFPGLDYSWGDTITALDRTKAACSAQVLGVSFEMGDDPPVFFATEYRQA